MLISSIHENQNVYEIRMSGNKVQKNVRLSKRQYDYR